MQITLSIWLPNRYKYRAVKESSPLLRTQSQLFIYAAVKPSSRCTQLYIHKNVQTLCAIYVQCIAHIFCTFHLWTKIIL